MNVSKKPLNYEHSFVLGFGGQVDFIRGAAEGFDGRGKSIC